MYSRQERIWRQTPREVEQEKYNETVNSSLNRIEAVLRGKEVRRPP